MCRRNTSAAAFRGGFDVLVLTWVKYSCITWLPIRLWTVKVWRWTPNRRWEPSLLNREPYRTHGHYGKSSDLCYAVISSDWEHDRFNLRIVVKLAAYIWKLITYQEIRRFLNQHYQIYRWIMNVLPMVRAWMCEIEIRSSKISLYWC